MPARRWRDYRTAAGRRPVKEFIGSLRDEEAAEVVAAMREVREEGLTAARKLRGDIWEVRADGNRVIHRVLFAPEGRRGLSCSRWPGSPRRRRRRPDLIALAERRLADWRSRRQ